MSNHIEIIPFGTPLPSGGSTGVVGTITLRGQSAIVWFGWGELEPCDNDETCVKERAIDEDVTVGSGNPAMGPLSLSMPSPKHTIIHYPTPSTQLLGGSSEEDMVLGQQVSCRLAKKIGWPIFVSCSFHEGSANGGGEWGLDVSPAMAVAMAETEVARILMREKERITRIAS